MSFKITQKVPPNINLITSTFLKIFSLNLKILKILNFVNSINHKLKGGAHEFLNENLQCLLFLFYHAFILRRWKIVTNCTNCFPLYMVAPWMT